MAGTSFYMFRFRFVPEMFSALSAAFLCSRAFRLFFCWFDCSLFCRLFGFRELNQVNFNGNSNEYHGCVSVRYNFLFISLLLFTKVQKITTWNRLIGSAYLRERELYDGQFWILKPSYIFCLGVLTLYTETNWMNSTSREIRRLNIKSFF